MTENASVAVDCTRESDGASVARADRFEVAGSCEVSLYFSRAVVAFQYRRKARSARGRIRPFGRIRASEKR